MSLPVTRTFTTGSGTIPTGGEANWAYNRTGSQVWEIDGGNTYVRSSDNTQDAAMHWTGDTFNANQYSEVVLKIVGSSGLGSGYGPAVRMDTATTNKTYYRLVCSANGWELFKFNNGTNASLASSASPTFANGDTVRLAISGSTFTLTKNGVAFGSPPTDSTLATGAVGVAHSSTTSIGDGVDTWTAGNTGSSIDATTSGSLAIAGQSVVLRPGSTTYLRYRK